MGDYLSDIDLKRKRKKKSTFLKLFCWVQWMIGSWLIFDKDCNALGF